MNQALDTGVSSDWKLERRERRRRERTLPPGLRADVCRVRRDDLAQGVLDMIDERVQLEARRLGGESAGRDVEISPVMRRKLLRALDQNQEFRGLIRRSISSILRTNHLLKTDPQAAEFVPENVGPMPRPSEGVLVLRSSIGLGTATYLEAEPEEWCRYVLGGSLAKMERGSDGDVTMDDDRGGLRILALGAGPGGLARTVTALESSAGIEVAEEDLVLPEETAMPCVVGPRGSSQDRHDLVAMVLPCPADTGAANHRRIYRDDHRRGFDLSAIGLRAWRAWVDSFIKSLPEVMTTDGTAYLLVPAGVRLASGYSRDPTLLDSVLESVAAADLEVIERVRVIEVEPVNQPFVGRARPERWSLLLRRRTPTSEVSSA